MLNLTRRSYKILLKTITKYYEVYNLKEKSMKIRLSILYVNTKRPLIWESSIYYLKNKTIHKTWYDIPERPVMSNCGTTTEKISNFLDGQLKPKMQKSLP